MQQKHQFKMNLPDDVLGWVAAEAAKNCRSKSAQIVYVLRTAKTAAGEDLAGLTPAAGSEAAAL